MLPVVTITGEEYLDLLHEREILKRIQTILKIEYFVRAKDLIDRINEIIEDDNRTS